MIRKGEGVQIFDVFSPLDEGALSVIFFMLVCFVGFFFFGGGVEGRRFIHCEAPSSNECPT